MAVLLGCVLFMAGALSCLFLIFVIGPLAVERIVLREFRDLNFPIHTLNSSSLKTLLESVEPISRLFLTEKSLAHMTEKIRDQHKVRVQAAVNGINSDSEMVAYLSEAGLLGELGISREQAAGMLTSTDWASHVLKPRSNHVQFFPGQAPQHPVRLPAEFENIGAVIVSFPIFFPKAWKAHASLIREISSVAKAFVIVRNEFWQRAVQLYLQARNANLDAVFFLHVPTDDVWTRDYGPTAVYSGKDENPVLIWNPYYVANQAYYKFDADVSANLAQSLGLPVYRLPLIVEGGNIITEGKGAIMMFDSVLSMNPELTMEGLEKILAEYLGCEQLLLLPSLKGEITGHVDMVVKFLDENTLMVASAHRRHRWHEGLEQTARRLAAANSINGKAYTIVRMPLPRRPASTHCFWSYVNSLILNRRVIVPVFGMAEDEEALQIYRSAMPGHEVAGVDFSSYPVGSIHCQSKEIPARTLLLSERGPASEDRRL